MASFNRHQCSACQAGFTLIEIVIALAVVSVAMLAVMNSSNTHAHVAGELEKRVISGWVASNAIAELRYSAKIDKLKTRSFSDNVKMGGSEWRVRTRVSKTDVEKVYLVKVEVREAANRKGKPMTVLTTAITDPT